VDLSKKFASEISPAERPPGPKERFPMSTKGTKATIAVAMQRIADLLLAACGRDAADCGMS
jgi:hypothetical protein